MTGTADRPGADRILRYADPAGPAGVAPRFAEAGAPPAEPRDEPAAAFPQLPGGLNPLIGPANAEPEPREDAWQVRVQAPAGADGAPVIVYIPGGGFMTGAGTVRWFDSPDLVERAGCVLVTVNYRIGALGHFGPDGSDAVHDSQRPLRDLLAALRWVRERIADFGGDPEQVTLAGDSAGAWYAFALSTMPEAAGLFRRTLLVSFPREAPLDVEALAARRAVFDEALAAQGADGIADAPVEAVLAAQAALAPAFAGRGMPLMPAAGGPVPAGLHDFERSAGALHVESIALLSTSEEAAAFLLRAPEQAFADPQVDGFIGARFARPDAVREHLAAKLPGASAKRRMVEALTLHQFRLCHLELAAAAARHGVDAHLASFSVPSGLPDAGSPHCLPLPFLFGERSAWHDAPMLEGIDDATFARTSSALQEWAVGFARDGAPGFEGRALAPSRPESPERLELAADGARLERPDELPLLG
ncbi:MAG: carboxylesterase family protein [Microbacteriaceae bacterium]|nr:carboxylesterase family protein [Microbacteriaceae bacterium]